MVDMTAEHPVHEISATRCYHVIYIILYRHSATRFIKVYKAVSLRKRLGSMSSSKISPYGLRSEVPPQQILNSHIILTVLEKFQIEIRFFIELHGNSKLSTSLPPSSDQKCSILNRLVIYKKSKLITDM